MGEKKVGFLLRFSQDRTGKVKKLIAAILSLVLGVVLTILSYGIWVILLKELTLLLLVWLVVVAAIFVRSIYKFITPYIQRIGVEDDNQQEVS